MRYGILSDIHSNLHALEIVLEALEGMAVDSYLCLGDIVGYGAFPNECCALLRELEGTVVRGNHDEAAVVAGKELWFTPAAAMCIAWTREQLNDVNLEFLGALDPLAGLPGITLCHGSIPDPDFYVTTPRQSLLSFRVQKTPMTFFGHTHCAGWFEYVPNTETLPEEYPSREGAVLMLEKGILYMVNPGAVGQPRDGLSTAAFAVYDTDRATVELHRVAYNVVAAQRAILDAGLPDFMAARLSVGV